MAKDSDNELLARAKSYDRQALSTIYDAYQPSIYRYVARQVEDMETARDLTAEVFQRFLKAIGNGQGPDNNIRSWLYTSAHNIVIDHYRRRQFRGHIPLTEHMADAYANTALEAEYRVDADLVRQALQTLTPDQRQVITLKFLAEFNNTEIAAVMDKPVSAIKSLQHRGLATLRRQLIPAKESASC